MSYSLTARILRGIVASASSPRTVRAVRLIRERMISEGRRPPVAWRKDARDQKARS